MFGAPEVRDTTHIFVTSIAKRNALRTSKRKWGMRVTVVTGGAATTYILTYNESSTSLIDNDNWVLDSTVSSSNPVREYFKGDGVTLDFDIASAGTVFLVEVNGQVMRPTLDYVVVDQTISFLAAPDVPDPDENNIGIYYFTSISTLTDPLDRVAVDTSGAVITINWADKKQRVWKGSDALAAPAEIEFDNDANAIHGRIFLQITDLAAIITFPANVIMNDAGFEATNPNEWEPGEIGKYLFDITYDGVDYTVLIFGPNA
jgi:hypothetical protein